MAAVWSATFGRVGGQPQEIIELKLVPLTREVGVNPLGARGRACPVPRRPLGRGSLAVARQRKGRGLHAGRRLSGQDGGGVRSAAARAARSQEVAQGKQGARAEVTSPAPTWSSVVTEVASAGTGKLRARVPVQGPT